MTMCDNNRDCPCTYACPRHGKCCACVAHHRDHNEGVPGCFFSNLSALLANMNRLWEYRGLPGCNQALVL